MMISYEQQQQQQQHFWWPSCNHTRTVVVVVSGPLMIINTRATSQLVCKCKLSCLLVGREFAGAICRNHRSKACKLQVANATIIIIIITSHADTIKQTILIITTSIIQRTWHMVFVCKNELILSANKDDNCLLLLNPALNLAGEKYCGFSALKFVSLS